MRKNIHPEHIYAMLVLALFALIGVLHLVGWLTGSAAWTTAALILSPIAIAVAFLPAGLAIAFVLWEKHLKK